MPKLSSYATVTPASADFVPILQGGANKKATAGDVGKLGVGVTVTGTPSAGQVLTATGPTGADWENVGVIGNTSNQLFMWANFH